MRGTRQARDAAGNLTADRNGARTFEYNAADRLYRVYENGQLIATYTYNALGQRIRKDTPNGAVIYHYDLQGRLIAETGLDGTPIRDYLYLEDRPVAQVDIAPTGEETLTYLHTDHLGTPRVATDETGTVVWRWQSDAFGATPPDEDPDGDGVATEVNLRFPGQYADGETGLYYNYFRYYDPQTGRYITSDPIGLEGGLNTYGYVLQNPVYWVDPYGLRSTFVERWWNNFTATNSKVLGPGTSAALSATHATTIKSVGGLTWGQALSVPRSSYVRGQAILAAGATTAIHQAQFYGALEFGIALGSAVGAIEVLDGVSVSDWWADYIFELIHGRKPPNSITDCKQNIEVQKKKGVELND